MVLSGDLVGFMSEVEGSALGYEFDPMANSRYFTIANGSYPEVGSAVQFDGIPQPYRFALAAVIDTGYLTYVCVCLFVYLGVCV